MRGRTLKILWGFIDMKFTLIHETYSCKSSELKSRGGTAQSIHSPELGEGCYLDREVKDA